MPRISQWVLLCAGLMVGLPTCAAFAHLSATKFFAKSNSHEVSTARFSPRLRTAWHFHDQAQQKTRSTTAGSSLSMSSDGNLQRRDLLKVASLAGAWSALCGPADAQPAAGLDVNKRGGGFENLDATRIGKDAPKGKSKKKAAGMAVFEDNVLGYAFAVPPNFKGQSQSVANGGQIIAFFDEDTGDINTRITLVAQPSPVKSLDELKQSFVPQGELRKEEFVQKAVGKEDGAVYIVETAVKDKSTAITLFALREQPAPSGAWLVSLTAQASSEVYGKYSKAFRDIVKSFRLIYPDFDPRDIADEDLGKAIKDVELSDTVKAVPFGGK